MSNRLTDLFQGRSAAPWLLCAIALLLFPFVFQSNSAITIMNQMAITIVFALSYNMLLGQGGMLSFGHAVYMGCLLYTSPSPRDRTRSRMPSSA